MAEDLSQALPLQTVGELVLHHGIDSTLFAAGAILVGPSDEYRAGLEAWAVKRNGDTTHGQTAKRANNWLLVRIQLGQAEGGWCLYSVQVNQQGWPTEGMAFVTCRIHPSKRHSGGLKADVRGWDPSNRGLMLPPLSYQGAIELLGDYGFEADPDTYAPHQAWLFVVKTPSVSVWVEESALKAMAACSVGQLAVGLNGINSWHQKGRTNRLLPALNRLARNGRNMVVRFDRPGSSGSQSENQAQLLFNRLKKNGASGGGWWCWLPYMPAKTDDFVSALISDTINQEKRCWLDHVVTKTGNGQSYRRLKKDWPGVVVDREFRSEDLLEPAKTHRVIVLKGATGTAKSRAMVNALELLEQRLGQKLIVLGAYHRSSLVHKGAAEFGVVSMSAPRGSAERQGFHENSTLRDGLFCCGESAFKDTNEMTLWHWYWELEQNPRPTVLILDEISQVLANWTMGGTEALRRIRSKVLEALEGLLQLSCVRVWAADALVGDIEMEWLKEITGEQPWLICSKFTRQRDLFIGSPGKSHERILQLQLNDVALAGGRFWLGHGTVAGLHHLMDAMPPAADGEELRITGEDDSRNDARVALLMADTEAQGPQYNRIGFSPAISCGISMAHTSVDLTAIVQAYCWQAEDVVQALNRARNAQRRILLRPNAVPDAAGITKETTPQAAAKAFEDRMRAGSLEVYAPLLEERHPATRKAVAFLEARRNLESFMNEWCLEGLLEEEGYLIRNIEDLETDVKSLDQGEPVIEAEKKPKVKRTAEGVNAYRQAALQRLVSGESTIDAERRAAEQHVDRGTYLDITEVDVSWAWSRAQEIGLHTLIRAGTVHSSSSEITAVWTALVNLNKEGAKRVSAALGVRADRIPGPMDPLDVRKIWPYVRAMGYRPIKAGKTRADGSRWKLTATRVN